MHFQRTAGLEQERDELEKKLTACLRGNVNLQEELSEAYRIKNQLADLHVAELTKSLEAEKQIKFFQSSVAAAFSERDTAIMEAEQAKEKEEIASQKFDTMKQKIEELSSAVLEEKTLSAKLQTNLGKEEKENEIFKQVFLEEKIKRELSGLRSFHSQHRLEIVNLLEKESSYIKSVVDDIKENIKLITINGELNSMSPQRDMTLQENDCRDVHISPDTGSDTITKENVYDVPSVSISGADDDSEALVQIPEDKENISDMPKACSSGTWDASEPLAQALQEKVAALMLLSQEEERYLLESNMNAALRSKLEELQRNLKQVTNEKVVALMELAQLKQEYRLLQEKVSDDVKHGKVSGSEEKSTFQYKDGRLKGLLKKTYFSQWINPHQAYAQNIGKKSSSSTMDFARMRIEYTALKESLESMEHLTSSIRRLRLSLVKVKESVPAEDTVDRKSEIIENVVTEANLLKTALGSSLPVSWSAEATDDFSSAEKVDCVSAAGFEMVELVILASHLIRNSCVKVRPYQGEPTFE